ncbi:hypothetical protein [Streptomyces sp. NPDC002644]
MQVIITPDTGTVTARRISPGVIDLETKNAGGETVSTVYVSDAKAWELFAALGEALEV